MKDKTSKIIEEYIAEFGEDHLSQTLSQRLKSEDGYTLTIICNVGVHAIPDSIIRGEKFVFSEGNIDLSGSDIIKQQMSVFLKSLSKKLKEKNWRKIYVVPSGHPMFYANIKLLVYYVTRLETIDLLYVKDGQYLELSIDHREDIIDKQ